MAAQREFSLKLYDDLRDRLRAKDQERAIALTYQLICSGRPLSEIIAETAPAALVGHCHLDVVPDSEQPTTSHLSPPVATLAAEFGIEDRAQVLGSADPKPGSTGGAAPSANEPDGEGPGSARTAHEGCDILDQLGRWAVDDPSSPARPATTTSATPALPLAALPDCDVSTAAAGHRSDAWRRGWRIGLLAAYSAFLVAATAFGLPLLHRIAATAPIAGPSMGAIAKVPAAIELASVPAATISRAGAAAPQPRPMTALSGASPPVARSLAALRSPATASAAAVAAPSLPAAPLDHQATTADPAQSSTAPRAAPPQPETAVAVNMMQPSPAAAPDHREAVDAADPAPPAAAPGAKASRAAGPPEITVLALVARGDDLLGTGDVATARLFYRRASDRGDSAAALRLGETFDTAFLRQAGLGGVAGDPAAARYWYRRARDLGSRDAELLLKTLQPAEQ